jgi:hypothetical protein
MTTYLRDLSDDELRVVLEAILQKLKISFEINRTEDGRLDWVEVSKEIKWKTN